MFHCSAVCGLIYGLSETTRRAAPMAKFAPVDIFDLVIFGGAGDLALRKLLPALYHRDLDGQLPPESRIISVGRRDLSREEFLEKVCDSLCDKLADS
jgi:glucose-6-phosphate 1-dehydrogenase